MEPSDEVPTFLYRAKCGALGVTFYGAVDEASAAAFEDALQYVEKHTPAKTVIPLFISSTGGDVYCAMKIIDLIRSSPLEIHTIAVGACMSAAAVIFSFGARRFVGEHATIMLHGVRVEAFEGKLKDVEIEAAEMRRFLPAAAPSPPLCCLTDYHTVVRSVTGSTHVCGT